ncbi:MAG: methyl-accepting chemotaxis protein, partial [Pseudomonadota bacterium]
LSQHTTAVAENWLPSVEAAKNMQVNLFEMQVQRLYFIGATDEMMAEGYEKRFSQIAVDFKNNRDLFAKNGVSAAKLAAFDKLAIDFAEKHKAVISLVKMGNASAAASKFQNQVIPTFKLMQTQLAEWVQQSVAGSQREVADAKVTQQQMTRLLLAGLALAVILAMAVSLIITQGVMRQLGGDPRYAFKVVTEIVSGNLAFNIETRRGDSTSLLYAMKGMAKSLAQMVIAVQESASNIQSATSDFAAGNLDLSNRTERQSIALQQTASSMDTLGSTAVDSANHVRQAGELAIGASNVASQGGAVVSRVVDTMKQINDSSKQIADITSVIDSIAFQTNILALNAAVEAARAGEQGRGFAVVAAEVRSLAQRSADAAKQIKTLIGASVERVSQGSQLADQAGATMQNVVTSIQRVTEVMAEINQVSLNQSSGISKVGDAIKQMDEATQQNVALVEQSAAAAESLNEQVHQLLQAVAVFTLPEQEVVALPASHNERHTPGLQLIGMAN